MTDSTKQPTPQDVVAAIDAEGFKALWLPLELKIGAAACVDFMYMGKDQTSKTISLYKHRDNRQYLNIGASGQCYKVSSRTVHYTYQPVSDADALAPFGSTVKTEKV